MIISTRPLTSKFRTLVNQDQVRWPAAAAGGFVYDTDLAQRLAALQLLRKGPDLDHS